MRASQRVTADGDAAGQLLARIFRRAFALAAGLRGGAFVLSGAGTAAVLAEFLFELLDHCVEAVTPGSEISQPGSADRLIGLQAHGRPGAWMQWAEAHPDAVRTPHRHALLPEVRVTIVVRTRAARCFRAR